MAEGAQIRHELLAMIFRQWRQEIALDVLHVHPRRLRGFSFAERGELDEFAAPVGGVVGALDLLYSGRRVSYEKEKQIGRAHV